MMKQLVFEQFLPVTLEEAWKFFSSPANLNLITPDKLHFKMISEVPAKVHRDLIIKYTIRPMINIPLRWTTRISKVEEGVVFVDEQIEGPYKKWIHEHHFEERDGGVLMTDKLSYDIGWSFLGRLAGWLWVDGQVKEIFRYRMKKLEDIFGEIRAEK